MVAGDERPVRRGAWSRGWVIAYALVAVLVSGLTWTLIRPQLVLTDGVPSATDPFTPLGVALVNVLLVVGAWVLLGLVHLGFVLGRRPDGGG
jgi:hypothetical protein